MYKTTLNWLIQDSAIDSLECVCCTQMLSSEISGVSVLDNPEGARWFRKNELILSSGYIFKDDEKLQLKLLSELKQIGCAALAIKLKDYLGTIPSIMVKEAEKLGFPLISIPYYHKYTDIIKEVYGSLEEEKIKQNTFIFQEIQTISDIYFKNQGLMAVLSYLSTYYKRPVMITTINFEPISFYIPECCTELNQIELTDISYHPITLSNIFDENNAKEKYHIFRIRDKILQFYTVLLPNMDYYLCIDADKEKMDEVHSRIISNSVLFLSMELEKQKLLNSKSLYPDYYSSFFSLLLNGSSKTKEELKIICDLYAFDPELKRVCITLQLQDEKGRNNIKNLYNQAIKLIQEQVKCFICFHGNFVSVFRFFPSIHQNLDAITESYMFSQTLYEELSAVFNLRIGVGKAHIGVDTIATSFEESFRAIDLQKQLNLPKQASSYWEQNIYHILSQTSMKDFTELYHDTIEPLVTYDKENGTDFLYTLKVYFQNTFNISETAKDLFIHRNTLSYRLQQIKELLRFDFSFDNNINALFSLYMGIWGSELSK